MSRRTHLDQFGNVERLQAVLRDRLGYQGGSLDDDALAAIPTVSKADLVEDQLAHPPFGARVRRPIDEITMVVESSGSTGGPREVHALSAQDEDIVVDMMAAALSTAGIVPADVVALTLPIGPAGGGAKMLLALRRIGATVLRVGSSSTADKVTAIQTYRATVVVGTPAYLDTLQAELIRRGTDPRTLPVRLLLVATQAMSIPWLQGVESTWGARVHEWYGNAAGVFAMTGSCGSLDGERHGVMHWNPDFVFIEVRSGGRLVSSSERGELIATHLQNSTAPLIRFRTGDEARFVAPGACTCGSAFPGIESGTVCRVDAMMKIRGMNVWPAVVDAKAEEAGLTRYWVLIDTDPQGRESVTLFAQPASGRLDASGLGDALHTATGISFRIVEWNGSQPPDFVTTSALGKQRQWVDKRATTTGTTQLADDRRPVASAAAGRGSG